MDAGGQSVAAEKIRMLYRQLPWVLAANVLITVLVAAALWSPAHASLYLGWGTAQGLQVLLRLILLACYRRRQPADAEMGVWGTACMIGAAASGIVWGSAALLILDPANPMSMVLVAFVIGGMAAGALTSLSSHLPSFTLFILTSVLPLAAVLMAEGGQMHTAMSIMVVVYACGLLATALRFNRTLTEMLRVTSEKQRLLDQMEQQIRDRTAELQAEVAVRQHAQAAAEQANQAQSRFLAAASHDLRQPLQSMVLFGAMLAKHVADPKGTEVLRMLQRCLETLTNLLNSLLDLSRLDVNIAQPEFAAIPLRALLQDIAAAYAPVAATKGLILILDAPAEGQVYSDKNLLGRMIRNLLENAVRYTDRGEIRLECRVEQHHARISVHDTGVGIPPDQTAHIFEEFHRGSDQGLGLGLAIVQRLSMILNHPVDVRSTVGQGSTFSIVVPLASPQREAPAKQTRATQAGAGKTVLVIDDDHMVLLSLSSTLRDWGYRTITAASTEQALKRLRQAGKPPHAVIVDYRLRSGETGTQAIAAIRRSFDQPIPAIILTGETAGAADEAAAELGLTALRKPVAPEDLAAALEQPGR